MPTVALATPDRPTLARSFAAAGWHVGTAADLVVTSGEGVDGHDGVPVLRLVSGGDAAIIAALDAGAADAVCSTGPDALIVARARVLIRRNVAPLRVGDLVIDMVARQVMRSGRVIALLPREYALLCQLARHAGQPIGRVALLAAVCGLRNDPGTNVIEVHMSRLRAKLDRGFARPLIVTDRGCGYRLDTG